MKHFNWQNIRLVLVLAVTGFLFSFAGKRNEQRIIKRSEVEFAGDNNLFITSEVVNKLLIENKTATHSMPKEKVDLNRLEKVINSHEMVEKSEVFVSIDGTLKAVVKQKTPIARVFDNDGSFYIDYKGNRMPLSENYSARVPILTGNLNDRNREAVADVLRHIHNDPFLKKNIIGIQVLPEGEIKMFNRNFDYVIEFGKMIRTDEKFRNYKAFLQKTMADSTIALYKKVNLKFNQQVVCTK